MNEPIEAKQSLASVAGAEVLHSATSDVPDRPSLPDKTAPTIAFITNFCPHYRVQTFEKLARRYKVQFYFFSQGTEWYWLKELGVRKGDFHGEYLGGANKSKSKMAFDLIHNLWRVPCDAYVKCVNGRIALPITYAIARLRGKPFVLWTGIWESLRTPFHLLIFPITRFIYRHSDALVVYGEHVKQYLVTQGVDEHRVFVAPHAVENESYCRRVPASEIAMLREKLKLPDGDRIVLYVGRLENLKGINFLLEGFAALKMPNVTLLLVGQGKESERLADLAKALGITEKVRFVGYIPPEDTVALYSLSYALVLPSISTPRFREPWGLVVNEAMNQGLPVIVTDAVGAAAGGLVRSGHNGLIVPERNAKGLAEALRTILDSAQLRAQMSQAARESIGQWDNDRMVEGFCQAIESVVYSSKDRPQPRIPK
jgi:glycosyltransferase involved in cell wall biosynthesis